MSDNTQLDIPVVRPGPSPAAAVALFVGVLAVGGLLLFFLWPRSQPLFNTGAVPTPTVVREAGSPGQSASSRTAEQPTIVPESSQEEKVIAAIKASVGGDKLGMISYDGVSKLAIEFHIAPSPSPAEADKAAREQVRGLLIALKGVPQPYVHATLNGLYDLPQRPNASVVQLDYLAATIKSTDWATLPADRIYSLADISSVDPAFTTQP